MRSCSRGRPSVNTAIRGSKKAVEHRSIIESGEAA
jgi:hypothetical protein